MIDISKLTGFTSFGSYFKSIPATPKLLMQRVGLRRSAEEQEADKAEGEHDMKKVLGVWDLIAMGIGMVLGAGVFVTTGTVAVENAGPAVIVAYIVAGVSAFLSSFIYAEFSVNTPYAGGGFSYIMNTFGEFTAWIVVMNLIMEYVLANAAVMRGFSGYLARLLGLNRTDYFVTTWVAPNKTYLLDWWAMGVVLVFTLLLIYGTKESAMFNNIMTIFHVLLVVFIIIAAFIKADVNNAKPFMPFSYRGIFDGASIVFFAFVGFDAVATTAEEVRNPGRDMPLGILGALGIVTICYVLMAAALVLMVPIDKIDTGAAFATAFKTVGLDWASHIVAAGAICGILTSTMIGMLGVSRIICCVAREALLPPVLALVHPKFGTPWVATLLQGVATAVIALFTDFADLANMVSIGTLFVFWVVALAQIWKRSYIPGVTTSAKKWNAIIHMALLVGFSLGFALWYNLEDGTGTRSWVGLVIFGGLCFLVSVSMAIFVPSEWVPEYYKVPLYPFTPCASILLNTFLISTLGKPAFERFGWWSLFCTCFYLLYSLHAGAARDERKKEIQDQFKVSVNKLAQ